jgi:hypothetical protein
MRRLSGKATDRLSLKVAFPYISMYSVEVGLGNIDTIDFFSTRLCHLYERLSNPPYTYIISLAQDFMRVVQLKPPLKFGVQSSAKVIVGPPGEILLQTLPSTHQQELAVDPG